MCSDQEEIPLLSEATSAVDTFKLKYFELFSVNSCEESKSQSPHFETSWLALPYNLCLVKAGLAKAVSSLKVPSGLPFREVGIAWKLGGKHLQHLLRFNESNIPQISGGQSGGGG